MNRRDFQVSVSLDQSLKEFVQHEAEKEDRSMAAMSRRIVAAQA
jgi:hypothetical protein